MAVTNMNFEKICVLFTISALISFAKANGSTKNALEGCNATLICNQPEGIQWINASSSKEIQVCYDESSSQSCLSTIQAGDNCTHDWITKSCKKSCGLCPEKECTEAVLPTLLPHSSTKDSSPTVKTTVSSTDKRTTDAGQGSGSSTATFDAKVFVLGLYFVSTVLLTNQ